MHPFTWHIATVILGCLVLKVVGHAVCYFLTCAFFTNLRGYLAPCVCEACLHCAGRQAQSESNVALMFIAPLEFSRSRVNAMLAVSKVVCDCCSVVLIHPRVSTAVLITAGFIAFFCSHHLSKSSSSQVYVAASQSAVREVIQITHKVCVHPSRVLACFYLALARPRVTLLASCEF